MWQSRLLRIGIFMLIGGGLYLALFMNCYGLDLPPERLAIPPKPASGTVRLAVIGDYGREGRGTADVAALIDHWQPDFVITTGDNNYPYGASATIDQNIGQYYRRFIYPYQGQYGPGATQNRFFPTLGNHDWWAANAQPYLDYFTLPGNERYYDFTWGPLHLFALDSDRHEPDGITATSRQAVWLQGRLASSQAPWKLVYMHHPPYSSGYHGSKPEMRWAFDAWGASAVLAGHDHDYERLLVDGLPYFVVGLGGGHRRPFNWPLPQSKVRYMIDYGALLIEADEAEITFRFVTRAGKIIDTFTLSKL